MELIDRNQYPQLDRLLWDTKQQYFTHKEAITIYEDRWRFLFETELTAKERKLSAGLTKEFGVFLPAVA